MNIYNLFKFLEVKKGRPIPFKAKLIYDPKSLTSEELNVRGDLYLANTPITSLPKNLKVGGSLYLYDTPLSKNYTIEQIAKMVVPNLKISQIKI